MNEEDNAEDGGKIDETESKSQDPSIDNANNNNNNWKEVQLRISENGEISVTDIVQETKRTVTENDLPEIDYVVQSGTTSSNASTTATVTETTDENKVSALKIESETLPSISEKKAEEEVTVTNATTIDSVEIKTTPATTTTTTTTEKAIVSEILTVTTASLPVSIATSSESSSLIATVVTDGSSSINTNTSANNSLSLTTNCSLATVSTQNLPVRKSPPLIVSTISKSSSANTKTVTATSTMSAATLSSSSNSKLDDHYKVPAPVNAIRNEIKGVKHKIEEKNPAEPPIKQPKQTILNHTLGLHKLSNNHPLKKHSQMSNDLVPVSGPKPSILEPPTIINKSLNAQPNRPGTPATHKWKSSTPGPPPCYVPKTTYSPIINVPKVQASVSKINEHKQHNNIKVSEQKQAQTTQSGTILNNKALIKTKPSTPIGYKTLRDPPKTWNPQISRANLTRHAPDSKCGDSKNVKPPKFFKLRNNMPRYLGNPASGVKPMYQVHLSPEKEKNESKPDKSEIKKHSIVKIDPKTLKPISERAPETSNLSRTCETKFPEQDLKINTSSVSIFNPLKLQSSPKSDRKSPKSPHSPKNKSSSPPNRREKLNLSFTPPNPFIPNLTSPTMSPNQFLFNTGPPGFPSYDPRVMAAYHTFLYGQQRMAFNASPIPGLNLELNQRNNFDLVSPSSPKLTKPETTTTNSTASTSAQHNSHKNNTKKPKEANKNEKSLQNAVEKLTQNKIKEVAKLGTSEKETGSETTKDEAVKNNNEDKTKNSDSANKNTTTGSKKDEQQSLKDDKKSEKSAPDGNRPNENSDTNNIKDKTESKVADKESSGVVINNNNNNNNNSGGADSHSVVPSEKGKLEIP